MTFVQLDIKLDWLGLAYGLIYPAPVVAHGRMAQDKIGKTMNNMMRIVLKRGFSWQGKNVTEMVREVGQLQVWRIVVSIFERDQSWNQLDPREQFVS